MDDKHSFACALFKDMLVGSMRAAGLVSKDKDDDDIRLLEGDVIVGIEDDMPSIRFSNRVHQLLYKSCPGRSLSSYWDKRLAIILYPIEFSFGP